MYIILKPVNLNRLDCIYFKRRQGQMKRLVVFALCITIFFVLLGCGRKEKNKILDFKAKDVENIEIYRFDIPVEAEGMLVTEREDIRSEERRVGKECRYE